MHLGFRSPKKEKPARGGQQKKPLGERLSDFRVQKAPDARSVPNLETRRKRGAYA